MTIKDIKQSNFTEPYSFNTDIEKELYNIGLSHGVEIAEKEIIEKACEIFKQYLINSYSAPPLLKSHIMQGVLSEKVNLEEMHRMQCINSLVYHFRMTLEKSYE